jgi:aryl-alcohol dehydrogenase-like predicted oxidoreductase
MKYRTLGSTDLRVSVVGLGTWQFGGEWGRDFQQAEVDAIFRRARELGINLIDTAECYGDHLSERLIGEALKRVGADRGAWAIATKFGHKFVKPFERIDTRTAATVREEVEGSLRALQTDYIDILQYHSWGDDTFFDDDVLAELGKLKDEGKFRHLGNSVGKNTNEKQVGASKKRGIQVVQIIYNRLEREPEDTTFPICQDQDLGVLARVPLASGYLSGKYEPGHQFDDQEVRGKWHKPEERDAKLREVQEIRFEEYHRQVNPEKVSMATWALGWCLQHPAVTCVIPGVKNVAQVESNAAAAGLKMVSEDHPQAE